MRIPYLLVGYATAVLARPGSDVEQTPFQSREQKRLGGGVLDVRAELIKAEIIPTGTPALIISLIDKFLPSLTLDVKWSKKNKAELGNTLDPDDLQDEPSIMIHSPGSVAGSQVGNMKYVVTLTDPDAPSRDNPEWSEMCHWIAANVSLSSSPSHIDQAFNPTSGKKENTAASLMPYKPPGPPPKTGKHRYVFLVFAPKNGTSEPLDLEKPSDRQHWGFGGERKGVREWAGAMGLVPVGANFIYAQNEEQ